MENTNMIRHATDKDISRIAEMIVVNYRINFFPNLKNEDFYFDELNVLDLAAEIVNDPEGLNNTYVFDDGVVKGMMRVKDDELVKLYVEPQFQSNKIGAKLFDYAVNELGVKWLWALKYNSRGIAFYEKNGFIQNGESMLEDDWIPLVKLVRS